MWKIKKWYLTTLNLDLRKRITNIGKRKINVELRLGK